MTSERLRRRSWASSSAVMAATKRSSGWFRWGPVPSPMRPYSPARRASRSPWARVRAAKPWVYRRWACSRASRSCPLSRASARANKASCGGSPRASSVCLRVRGPSRVSSLSRRLSASRMAPSASRATSCRAWGSASRPSQARMRRSFSTISASESRRKRKCWVRERMVGGMRSGSVVAKMKITWGGGSSSVFKSALKALLDIMWASSRITTLCWPRMGLSRMRSRSSRTSSTELLEAASISSTSGCRPSRTSRQPSQVPQGLGSLEQLTAWAISRALLVLPTPRGPENR
ncbi:hypothetical protein Mcate_02788 [Meiothermus taiwanensis]|uniref:Uncharacterized protein n=1 Tax=Meiothermus taiwanensis TaxID=172827 RepID=A0A399DPH0_9DEIN|nr:hypothetical protein Mcate_02788 [Meiothermus taiwanensis]